MACCGDDEPIQFRYTSDGVLQRSDDGGNTFYDAPTYDPRVYSPQFPPLPGEDGNDKKCAAAASAVLLIKEQVGDQLTDDMSRYTLSQLITDWVKTLIETSNPFLGLLTVITNQIFALIIATLRPALTDGVYDQLLCILYCDSGADATVNDAQWEQIRSDITDQITGIAGVFFEHLIYLLGTTGVTNLLRSGAAATGDCEDCDCGGCAATWIIGNVDGNTAYGTIDSVVGSVYTVTGGIAFDSNYYAILRTTDETECCEVIDWNVVSGSISVAGVNRIVCPNTQHVGNISFGVILGIGSVNYIGIQSNAAFTVEITFA